MAKRIRKSHWREYWELRASGLSPTEAAREMDLRHDDVRGRTFAEAEKRQLRKTEGFSADFAIEAEIVAAQRQWDEVAGTSLSSFSPAPGSAPASDWLG